MEHHAQCKMNRDEEQGAFLPWADAGRHNPKQSHDLASPSRKTAGTHRPTWNTRSWAARLSAPKKERRAARRRRSRRPNEKNSSPTPHSPTPFDKTRLSARNRAQGLAGWCVGIMQGTACPVPSTILFGTGVLFEGRSSSEACTPPSNDTLTVRCKAASGNEDV